MTSFHCVLALPSNGMACDCSERGHILFNTVDVYLLRHCWAGWGGLCAFAENEQYSRNLYP